MVALPPQSDRKLGWEKPRRMLGSSNPQVRSSYWYCAVVLLMRHMHGHKKVMDFRRPNYWSDAVNGLRRLKRGRVMVVRNVPLNG